jgi:hypothetical protein
MKPSDCHLRHVANARDYLRYLAVALIAPAVELIFGQQAGVALACGKVHLRAAPPRFLSCAIVEHGGAAVLIDGSRRSAFAADHEREQTAKSNTNRGVPVHYQLL